MKTDRFLLEELKKIHTLLQRDNNVYRFEYEDIDLSELINHIVCERVFYFKSKYEEFEYLGLGHSQTLKASDLNEFLLTHPDQYFFASLMFEADPKKADLILPEWVFIKKGHKTKLIINKSSEYDSFSSPSLFFNTNFDLNLYDPLIPPWNSFEELPEHDQWKEIINQCDDLFNSNELKKIVLSRKKIFEYNEPIDPIVFFKAVMEKNQANKSYFIFNQMSFDHAFITLTPEKLFSIEDNIFESISLAASAPRGNSLKEDKEFEETLNTSDKLLREHNLVTDEIMEKLKPFATELKKLPTETMKLTYIQHQSTPIKAVLHSNTNPIELISLLHPTPAVGGIPWDKARLKISELEPYSRDNYAAPIGILSTHYSELAVGIRSALIEKTKLTLFGGAGIVSGSIAEDEWIETGVKMNPFLKVINHE